ncbi:MAG: DUF1735 domain-containing protein [Rikenellaceae bacterium]
MKRVLCNLAVAISLLFGATSCYDDVVQDYTFSSAYFAQQQPVRTVIAGRSGVAEANEMCVGAAVGGKLEVDLDDWARFAVDESTITAEMGMTFLEMGLEVMPEDYYELSDPNKMVITKVNNFIMEVDVSFTDKFFDDPDAVDAKYAIPFVLVDSSCDSLLASKYYSVVAVKYQSKYHGTYYVQGYTAKRDGNEYVDITPYSNPDLSQNITSATTTTGRNSISRVGQTLTVGSTTLENGNVEITVPSEEEIAANEGGAVVNEDGSINVAVAAAVGDVSVVGGTGSGKMWYDEETHDCIFEIDYLVTASGVYFAVHETLTRRQDPLLDLRVEFWSTESEE